MASLLRQIVAGPRARHPEAGLDLCYVTDNIIVTSGPSSTYPQRAYRNPTDQLVKFLDYKHGEHWSVWEFRAEGTGYPDSEVYGRVKHYPWPDHHPPPFALVPNIMAGMRNWLKDEEKKGKNVVVVHCKAGKGRSGTVACSYLISEEGWKVEDALARFTQRRMRSGFGNGVSIPSQLRWIGYVDRWSKSGKRYVERPVEIVEIHAWGLREGVKVQIEGFVEEGRKIKVFHTFSNQERLIVDGGNADTSTSPVAGVAAAAGFANNSEAPSSVQTVQSASDPSLIDGSDIPPQPEKSDRQGTEMGGKAVIFRPKKQIILPTSDVCIDIERRNRARFGYTMVTAVAHVWFNVFFEGGGTKDSTDTTPAGLPKLETKEAEENDRGVFEIAWEAMDGLKGSSRKGTRAFDRIAVIWRALGDEKDGAAKVVNVPEPGEEVPESRAADWAGSDSPAAPNADLGLRVQSPASADVSRASTIKSKLGDAADAVEGRKERNEDEESLHAVQSHVDEEDTHILETIKAKQESQS